MAFFAHNDMGKNESVETNRTQTWLSSSLNSESKFMPNPSAQPFVPKWNPSSSQQLNRLLSHNAGNSFEHGNLKEDARRALEIMNGVTHPVSTTDAPSQHIALHLLSKVLDDETIFNLEEGNQAPDTTFPLSVDANIRCVDPPSWTPSPHASPDCDPEQRLSSSMSGESIWQNSDINQNSSIPITTANSLPHVIGWSTQSQISPQATYPQVRSDMGSASSILNGFDNLPSPQMSSSLESVGNGGFYGSHFFTSVMPDEWKQMSDSESNSCTDVVDQGPFEFNSASPVQAAPGLVYLSGSWPQNTSVNDHAQTNGGDGKLMNGYCSSWKGGDYTEQQGRRVQFRRSNSSKSDDETWINGGKQVTSSELHLRLDLCHEQLKYLEKERHKAELDICKFWPTRRISSSGTVAPCRPHHSSSRVDRLLVDVMKEHAKVEALVGRIERIRHSPLNINISESVDEFMACIRRLQSHRKEEMGGRNKKPTAGPRSPDGKDFFNLVAAVRDLAISIRRCRTSVWCASQLAVAEMSKIAAPNPRCRSSNSESGVDCAPLPSPGSSGVS